MKRIYADFDARTPDNRIALRVHGSLKSLKKTPVVLGERVLLTDNELEVEAVIEKGPDYFLAKPDWETLVDIDEKEK